MSDARSVLAEWFEQFLGEQLPAQGDADLFDQFDLEGVEASDFMDAFFDHFGIASDDYRWYFHHADEGWNIGALFFAPRYRRVERIPITPDILTRTIETGRWPVQYPAHTLPNVRWDIRLNQAMLLVTLAWGALALWQRIVR